MIHISDHGHMMNHCIEIYINLVFNNNNNFFFFSLWILFLVSKIYTTTKTMHIESILWDCFNYFFFSLSFCWSNSHLIRLIYTWFDGWYFFFICVAIKLHHSQLDSFGEWPIYYYSKYSILFSSDEWFQYAFFFILYECMYKDHTDLAVIRIDTETGMDIKHLPKSVKLWHEYQFHIYIWPQFLFVKTWKFRCRSIDLQYEHAL